MTWFRIDDGWPTHSKVRRADQQGRALWCVVGPMCARENTDGHVDPFMIKDSWAALAGVNGPKAAKLLVACGLWHDHSTIQSCEKCMDVTNGGIEPGWFYFHDWTDYQLDKAGKENSIHRKRERRRKHLTESEAGRAIVGLVRARDRDLCRYCGVLTVWVDGRGGDRRSDQTGTIDHLDPFDWDNSVANCVVACRLHNSEKNNRTPEEWVEAGGLPLRPEPGKYRPGSIQDQSAGLIQPMEDQAETNPGARVTRERGPGDWSGLGPGLDPGLVPAGSQTSTNGHPHGAGSGPLNGERR